MFVLTAVAVILVLAGGLIYTRSPHLAFPEATADSRGITLQTLIVTAVLVLLAVAVGVLLLALSQSGLDDLEGSTQNLRSVESQGAWVTRCVEDAMGDCEVDRDGRVLATERRFVSGQDCRTNEVPQILTRGEHAGDLECVAYGFVLIPKAQCAEGDDCAFTPSAGSHKCEYSTDGPSAEHTHPAGDMAVIIDHAQQRCYTTQEACDEFDVERRAKFGLDDQFDAAGSKCDAARRGGGTLNLTPPPLPDDDDGDDDDS